MDLARQCPCRFKFSTSKQWLRTFLFFVFECACLLSLILFRNADLAFSSDMLRRRNFAPCESEIWHFNANANLCFVPQVRRITRGRQWARMVGRLQKDEDTCLFRPSMTLSLSDICYMSDLTSRCPCLYLGAWCINCKTWSRSTQCWYARWLYEGEMALSKSYIGEQCSMDHTCQSLWGALDNLHPMIPEQTMGASCRTVLSTSHHVFSWQNLLRPSDLRVKGMMLCCKHNARLGWVLSVLWRTRLTDDKT